MDLKQERQTRGTVGERHTNDEEIAWVNALKALDSMKDEYEFEQAYQQALQNLAEAIFDMDFQNNDVEPLNNAD